MVGEVVCWTSLAFSLGLCWRDGDSVLGYISFGNDSKLHLFLYLYILNVSSNAHVKGIRILHITPGPRTSNFIQFSKM